MILDERGNACPYPLIHAKEAMESISKDEFVEVIVDNEIALQNLQKLAKHKNYHYSINCITPTEYRIHMSK